MPQHRARSFFASCDECRFQGPAAAPDGLSRERSLELKRAAPPASATKATPVKPKGLKVYGMKEGQVQVVDTTAKKGKK